MTIKELRRLATAATPGPWTTQGHTGSSEIDGSNPYTVFEINGGAIRVVDVAYDRDYYYPEGGVTGEPDAAYIAAADPTTILALLDVVEAAVAWRGDKWVGWTLTTETRLGAAVDALR